MMSNKTPSADLAVCYRIYPRVSGHPVFGFTDKLDLVRLNLETFRAAAGNLKLKLWFLLDNCPPAYEDLIRSFFPSNSLEIINLGGEGNGATFCRQIDVLTAQQEAELVYFAEDDYLYLPGALERSVDFIKKHPETEFLTLFDHAAHYTQYIHQLGGDTISEGEHVWRKVASTCLTFMARRTSLVETADVFRTFAAGNSDLAIWLSLTKRGVLNPWSFIRSLNDGLFVSASHALAWRHATRQILRGKRRSIWAPQPSLATHMEMNGLAPNVDWNKIYGSRIQIK